MLVAAALRLSLRKALEGATFAGINVFDSAATAFDELIKDTPQPFLVISIDEDRTSFSGYDLLGGVREMDIVIDVAIASEVTDKGGIILPHTDESLELAINYTVRQVMRVLQVDEGDWSNIFRSLVGRIKNIETQRGADAKDGVRYAARQIVLTVEPIDEPGFGDEINAAWDSFLNAMRGDVDLARLVDGFEEEMVGVALPDWKQAQARLGFHRGLLAAIAIGPLLPGEEPAPFSFGSSDGDHLEAEAYGLIAEGVEPAAPTIATTTLA